MHTMEHRYVELNKRMNAVNGVGAGVITALTLVSTWGQWRICLTVAATQGFVILFNTLLVNNVLLHRWGVRRAEILRTAVNLATGVMINHVAHWPIAAWLFLPYVALAFDHLGAKVARIVVATTCVVQSAFALLDGVPWVYPLTFAAFAVFCSAISHVRFNVIRAMLASADEQRRVLQLETEARKRAELELRQAQKLEALGRLASGVAHEINTPLQFVTNSAQFLTESLEQLVAALGRLQATDTATLRAAVDAIAVEVDIDYLQETVPEAARMTMEGLGRVTDIVTSLKELANPARATKVTLDLNRAVHTALTIARHEYRYVADIDEELGEIPAVLCHPGEIHQVLLGLIVNAAHAVSASHDGAKGMIVIRTARSGGDVVVSVADDGDGIPIEIQEKIFEPFFTTKEVGHGTGQGLAIARSIIERHGGKISFETRAHRGTTFTIRLPALAEDKRAA